MTAARFPMFSAAVLLALVALATAAADYRVTATRGAVPSYSGGTALSQPSPAHQTIAGRAHFITQTRNFLPQYTEYRAILPKYLTNTVVRTKGYVPIMATNVRTKGYGPIMATKVRRNDYMTICPKGK